MPKTEMIATTGQNFQASEPNKDEMFFFHCSKCNSVHYRHAGYIEILMPYILADGEKKVSSDSLPVKVCCKCKSCYVWYNSKMLDVTKQIDLEAWEKTEKAMQKATGPGGDC